MTSLIVLHGLFTYGLRSQLWTYKDTTRKIWTDIEMKTSVVDQCWHLLSWVKWERFVLLTSEYLFIDFFSLEMKNSLFLVSITLAIIKLWFSTLLLSRFLVKFTRLFIWGENKNKNALEYVQILFYSMSEKSSP